MDKYKSVNAARSRDTCHEQSGHTSRHFVIAGACMQHHVWSYHVNGHTTAFTMLIGLSSRDRVQSPHRHRASDAKRHRRIEPGYLLIASNKKGMKNVSPIVAFFELINTRPL